MAIYNSPLTNPVQSIKVRMSRRCLSSYHRLSDIPALDILT
jgi:hypothetical protein